MAVLLQRQPGAGGATVRIKPVRRIFTSATQYHF
jgi:hypothetical protein